MVFQNASAYQNLTIGAAFVNQNPGSPEHLWIVVAITLDPEAVIFNVTTRRADSDLTCILQPSDHPFIKHESVIAYRRGQLITDAIFERLQRSGCIIQPSASIEVVKRIRDGAIGATRSKFISPKLQTIISANPVS